SVVKGSNVRTFSANVMTEILSVGLSLTNSLIFSLATSSLLGTKSSASIERETSIEKIMSFTFMLLGLYFCAKRGCVKEKLIYPHPVIPTIKNTNRKKLLTCDLFFWGGRASLTLENTFQ